MHHFHSCEYLTLDFNHHPVEFLLSPYASNGHCKPTSQKLSESVLGGLVVNDSTFFASALLIRELSPDTAIPQSISSGLNREHRPYSLHDVESNVHHYNVEYSKISHQGQFTLSIDFTNAHQHVCSGDADILKCSPAIILREVTNL